MNGIGSNDHAMGTDHGEVDDVMTDGTPDRASDVMSDGTPDRASDVMSDDTPDRSTDVMSDDEERDVGN